MILELKGIYKEYLQGKMKVPVLKDVNFSMEEGEYVAIMGAFCLSSAACPFFCAQYSRSVTRFLLPFKRSI